MKLESKIFPSWLLGCRICLKWWWLILMTWESLFVLNVKGCGMFRSTAISPPISEAFSFVKSWQKTQHQSSWYDMISLVKFLVSWLVWTQIISVIEHNYKIYANVSNKSKYQSAKQKIKTLNQDFYTGSAKLCSSYFLLLPNHVVNNMITN